MERIFYFNKPPSNTPTEKMPDGPLTGNGDIGVAVGCEKPGELLFCLGKNDLWNSDSRWETPGTRSYGILSVRCPQGAGKFRAEQHLSDGTILAELSAEWGSIQVKTKVLRNSNLILQDITCMRGNCRVHVDLRHSSRGKTFRPE